MRLVLRVRDRLQQPVGVRLQPQESRAAAPFPGGSAAAVTCGGSTRRVRAEDVEAGIRRDSIEPRSRRPGPFETDAGPVSPVAQERLLERLLGSSKEPSPPIAVELHLASVALDEGGDAGLVEGDCASRHRRIVSNRASLGQRASCRRAESSSRSPVSAATTTAQGHHGPPLAASRLGWRRRLDEHRLPTSTKRAVARIEPVTPPRSAGAREVHRGLEGVRRHVHDHRHPPLGARGQPVDDDRRPTLAP